MRQGRPWPLAGLGTILLTLTGLTANGGAAAAPRLADRQADARPTLQEPELFADGTISTPDDELGITFTPDGETAYFTKRTPTTNTAPRLVICVSHRVSGRWGEPEVAPFSGTFNDFGPTISPDGGRLFFSSDRPFKAPEGAPATAAGVDLWVMESVAGGWGEPHNLGAPVNSAAAEQHPSVAADGTLYFASDRVGGKGSFDLYRSRLVHGQYSEPEALSELNSAAYEGQPCIAPDQSFLVFASVGREDAFHGGGVLYPRADLYVSFRDSAGHWAAARHLGTPINSASSESNPSLSPDGQWLYFTSDRSPFTIPMPRRLDAGSFAQQLRSTLSGSGNIYRIPVSALRGQGAAAPAPGKEPSPGARTTDSQAASAPALQPSLLPPPYSSTQPIDEPRLLGEGVLSTAADEFAPQFTADGRTLYFNRSVPRSQLYAIFVSTFVDGHWSSPQVAPFSGTWRDFDPVLSPDGSRLFFVSDRPHDGQPSSEYSVWALDRQTNGAWGEPWRLPAPINPPPGDRLGGSAHFISATRDGALYFTSTRDGNLGPADVYRTRWANGHYTPAENLGPNINGPGWLNLEAIVSPDESLLIVSAYGHPDTLGDSDLYVSFRRDGAWTPLKNLGPRINSAARDYSPRFSADGRYLFFASERGLPIDPRKAPFTYRELTTAIRGVRNGLGDLYQVDLAAAVKDAQVLK